MSGIVTFDNTDMFSVRLAQVGKISTRLTGARLVADATGEAVRVTVTLAVAVTTPLSVVDIPVVVAFVVTAVVDVVVVALLESTVVVKVTSEVGVTRTVVSTSVVTVTIATPESVASVVVPIVVAFAAESSREIETDITLSFMKLVRSSRQTYRFEHRKRFRLPRRYRAYYMRPAMSRELQYRFVQMQERVREYPRTRRTIQ